VPDITAILARLESADPGDERAGTAQLRSFARQYAKKISPLYHVIPWTDYLVSEEDFERIYAQTAELTDNLRSVTPESMVEAMRRFPPSLMVFRLLSAYQWEELADIVKRLRGVAIPKEALHEVERGRRTLNARAIDALATTLFNVISGAELALDETFDASKYRTRKAKFDTREGWPSVARAATGPLGLRHVLYERYTGRPFAYVRDALSEVKGELLEAPVAALLKAAEIPFEKIEDNRLEGFGQAPDFVLPNRGDMQVMIEAKLSEDGGTARDKASRIQRLYDEIGGRPIALIAVVDGKGFRRINDVLAPILRHTRGRTFFLSNLAELVEVPEVARLRAR
jgi:hypothetical protein